LNVYREICRRAKQIEKYDRDQARQLRKSGLSIANNISEGSGCRAGTRRQRFFDALGSARETLCNLECAEIAGYTKPVGPELRNSFNHIIGVLVKLTR
jgi:four helix bundle protein